jgi:hypothetical protein
MKKTKTLLTVLCIINAYAINAQTEFKDVAPLFYKHCGGCHHNGGLQFSLMQYSDIFANAISVRNNILSGYMPPWPPDPAYRQFIHERILSNTEKNLIVDWINNGLLPGDTTLAPPIPAFTGTQLKGNPDIVLKFPVLTSTATSADKYYCLNLPVNLAQDRYIRALEFIPGNPAIIHHAVITVDTTGTATNNLAGNCYNFQGQVNIGDYAPGMGPTVFPGNPPARLGMRLKANSIISVQFHIPAGTAGLQDSSELHLFLYPLNTPNIREMFFETLLQNWSFFIPANSTANVAASFPTTGSLLSPVSLYAAFVHSHNTCVKITNYATNNADTIPLIRVPQWNFHWQGQYTYPAMVKIPQGYKLVAEHFYDNTINNPNTPNPNQAVLPGLATDDEMLFDSYIFTPYLPGDEFINIDSLVANDTLFFQTSNLDDDQTIFGMQVYPNPFINAVNFTYSILNAQPVKLIIYNLHGQVVRIYGSVESAGYHTYSWDGKDAMGHTVSSGLYFYRLFAGQKVVSGKLLFEN